MKYFGAVVVLVMLYGCASIGAKEYDISKYTLFDSGTLTIVKYPNEWFDPNDFRATNEKKKQNLRDRGAPNAMIDQFDQLLVHARGMELKMEEDGSNELFAYCRLGFIFNKQTTIPVTKTGALKLKLKSPDSKQTTEVTCKGLLIRQKTGQGSRFYDTARSPTTIAWDFQQPEQGHPTLVYARVNHEFWGWTVLEARLE